MNFLKKFKLRRKMIYSFLIITGLMFVAVGFIMYGLLANQNQIETMHDMADEAALATALELDLINGQRVFKQFLNSSDPDLIVEFEEYSRHIEQNLEKLLSVTKAEERIAYLENIQAGIQNYYIGFQQFKQLDDERAEEYVETAGQGGEIVVALANLVETAGHFNDMATEMKLTQASNDLLLARLYAMKFFTFHDETEYNNYLTQFSKFESKINSLYVLKSDLNYKLDYDVIQKAKDQYKDGMADLLTVIKAIDNKVLLMDDQERSVGVDIGLIVDDVNEDQMLLEDKVKSNSATLITLAIAISVAVIILTFFIASWLIRVILNPILALKETFNDISSGDVDLEFRLPEVRGDEIGEMSHAFNLFMVNLKEIMDKVNLQNWTKTAQTDLNRVLRRPENLQSLSSAVLNFLCDYLKAEVGTMYIRREDDLALKATYAFENRKGLRDTYEYGEGIIGQCAVEMNPFIMTDIPEGYMNIQSSLGEYQPKNILVFPCVFEDETKAVIELGTFKALTDKELNLVAALADAIAIAIHSTIVQDQLKALLDRTMTQSEELQMQQEELRQSNEELEEQTRALKDSEQRLQAQQEELRVSNEELEQRTKQLEAQKKALDDNNREILIKQQEVIEKAEQLEMANTYKSEFLANMSHELRTPLNSILVLSQLLSERNQETPLTQKEQDFAKTIHTSGTDLLALINDVLDLSKVEAGHLEIAHEPITVDKLLRETENMFGPMAEVKNIHFRTARGHDIPDVIYSDSLRLHQIIKNLVSNSLKFTEEGEVVLSLRRPSAFECDTVEMNKESTLAIEVSDTGIGIPEDKQQIIFEAFRQTDGTTSRKYGGTGLGLTISRELSALLGGHILVESSLGEGSRFVLLIPSTKPEAATPVETKEVKIPSENIKPLEAPVNPISKKHKTNTLLIIEDDINFATILANMAEEKGFMCHIANDGQSGLALAVQVRPTAIVLDLGLPDVDGMELAEKFGRLEATKNIPIHVISGKATDKKSQLPTSIIGFLQKPVDVKTIYKTLAKIEGISKNETPKLLVIGECSGEDFDQFRKLGNIAVTKVLSGQEAYDLMENEVYDCIVIDFNLKELEGDDLFKKITQIKGGIPTIIYSEQELDDENLQSISAYSESIILKSPKSNERLKDEVSLFLHGMQSTMNMNPNSSELHMDMILDELKDQVNHEDLFMGKRVLIVDDDERNVFALSSLLAQHGFEYEISSNGHDAIERFKRQEVFHLVLMDIMMPKMDGYEAIRGIRALGNGKDIPIIALTAKAMKDDRKKCIDAGANDYLTKPLNVEKLISTMKVWLS